MFCVGNCIIDLFVQSFVSVVEITKIEGQNVMLQMKI